MPFDSFFSRFDHWKWPKLAKIKCPKTVVFRNMGIYKIVNTPWISGGGGRLGPFRVSQILPCYSMKSTIALDIIKLVTCDTCVFVFSMRITCDIDVTNRLLPSFNMKQKGKAAKSQVSVGKKPGSKEGEIFLLVCTKQDRSGAHYRVCIAAIIYFFWTSKINFAYLLLFNSNKLR